MAKEAQNAVEGISDPELKRIAFEKILNDLLNSDTRKVNSDSTFPAKKVKKRNSKTTGKSNKDGPQSQVKALIDEGFFKKPKTLSEVKTELGTRGFHIPLTHLSAPLVRLCRQKFLRRSKESSGTYSYSNW